MTNPIAPTAAYHAVADLLKLVKIGRDSWQVHEWSPERNAWVAGPTLPHLLAQSARAERTHELALLLAGWSEEDASHEAARHSMCGLNARDRIARSLTSPE